MVELDKKIFEKCDNAIVISGSARSGTTILGTILHSLNDIEYVFEPPMLFSLFTLIDRIDEKQWKLLYETYLYEEFLVNALAGRGLNCNRVDDSSIYKVKPEWLIEERLNRSLRKAEAERLVQSSRVAYKMPSVVPFLPQLKKYFPGTTVIIMLREAPEVFHSLLKKGWYNDKILREENITWPNRLLKGLRIPFWVDPQDDEKWYEMDELHRIAYYYIRVNQPIEEIPGCIVVRYGDLIKNPEATINLIAEQLGLVWGEKTSHILGTVGRRQRKIDSDILGHLKPEVREQVEHYSDISAKSPLGHS